MLAPALCLPATDYGERVTHVPWDGRTGMSPMGRGHTMTQCAAMLSLAPHCRKQLQKKPPPASQESSHRRPRGPWEDKGRKRERGEREINNFLHSHGSSPSYKKHMVPDTIFSSTVTWSIWRLMAAWRAVVKHSLLVTHT